MQRPTRDFYGKVADPISVTRHNTNMNKDIENETKRSFKDKIKNESKFDNMKSINKFRGNDQKVKVCYNCGNKGHYSYDCRKIRSKSAAGLIADQSNSSENENEQVNSEITESACACFSVQEALNVTCSHGNNLKLDIASAAVQNSVEISNSSKMLLSQGHVGRHRVQVMRDTGCSCVIVDKKYVLENQYTGKSKPCRLIDSTLKYFPVARIYIVTEYYIGHIEALVLEKPLYSLIIGNISKEKDLANNVTLLENESDGNSSSDNSVGAAVETRAQRYKVKQEKPLKVMKQIDTNIDKKTLVKLQNEDKTLKKYLDYAECNKVIRSGLNNESRFLVEKELLFRRYISPKYKESLQQIVVPVTLRQRILKLAHDGVMAGHLGSAKTVSRIFQHFYWPDLEKDVIRFCRSCDVCQRTIPKGKVGKVPLGSMPMIAQPFSRVALDLIGPLPITSGKHRYILTIVDYASRFPEAVPLKNKESETVAEALLAVYSRIGFPDEVFHDQGTEFMSNVMNEVNRLLSIKSLNTTPYHPMANGLNERFNGVLKSMLRKMCHEQPKEWDRFLNPLLFAYRECPQESTGFSPFELIYGRCVRGPLALLYDVWADKVESDEVLSTYDYVLNLKQRLEETCKLAQKI